MLQVLEKALMAELEGLQKIHVAVAKQVTRLQVCPIRMIKIKENMHAYGTFKSSVVHSSEQNCVQSTNMITVQCEEAILKELLEKARAESGQQDRPAAPSTNDAAMEE